MVSPECITGLLSANNNNILFNDVKGVELTYSEMASIEGDGWKNGLAYAIYGGGFSLLCSFFANFIPGVNVSILASTIAGAYYGWNIGYPKSDSRYDDYIRMGFGFFDMIGPDLD